jgi:PEGA domain
MKRHVLLIAASLSLPPLVFAGKNPADYPLKLHILQQNWSSHNVRYNEYKGTGRGNIWEGDSVHAFEFTYDCSFGLTRTARNEPYAAKWKKPQQRLALLAAQIGRNDKYQECELKTTVHAGVYILGARGISEMSQEDYKEWKAKRAGAGAQPETATPLSASKVSVASTPESAEIEVDGEFMGSTPSVLELDPGEHNIAVRKAGYKAWERKLKVTAGEIKVNAELEAESPK